MNVIRDAAILKFGDGYIVHTCDSAGGIGGLQLDVLSVDIELVSLETLKVAIMENISLGADPLSVSLTFCNSPEYVRDAVDRVREFLYRFKDVKLVVSTEKNFRTLQTGVGVSVVGFTRSLRVGGAVPGCGVYVLGMPLVGKEYIQRIQDAMDFDELMELLKTDGVGEVIPVGSRGILQEVELLAKNSGLNFVPEVEGEWLSKSAGPATCAVFYSRFHPGFPKVRRIGRLL
ncbi:MAG: alpha-ribazole kinase [Synergistetes bacterium]|nr:alpha-ribazole kinase [Synergistota bacterium]